MLLYFDERVRDSAGSAMCSAPSFFWTITDTRPQDPRGGYAFLPPFMFANGFAIAIIDDMDTGSNGVAAYCRSVLKTLTKVEECMSTFTSMAMDEPTPLCPAGFTNILPVIAHTLVAATNYFVKNERESNAGDVKWKKGDGKLFARIVEVCLYAGNPTGESSERNQTMRRGVLDFIVEPSIFRATPMRNTTPMLDLMRDSVGQEKVYGILKISKTLKALMTNLRDNEEVMASGSIGGIKLCKRAQLGKKTY